MTRMTHVPVAGAIVAMLLAATGTVTAHAVPDSISDALAAVGVVTKTHSLVSPSDLQTLDLSDARSTQLSIKSPYGHEISIGVVNDSITNAVGTIVGDEEVKVVSTASKHSYVLTHSNELPGTAYTVMDEPSDSVNQFEIAIDGKPATLNKQENGSVIVADETGQVQNLIAPPWARDTKGNQVEARYDVAGSTLIQTVVLKGNEEFPLIGGLPVACDWFFCTVEINREWTRGIAFYGDLSPFAAAICAPLRSAGGWPAIVCATVIAGMATWLTHTAADAYDRGMCLGIRAMIYSPAATMHPAVYSGPNCF